MARTRTEHRCSSCGAGSPRWVGRCPTCQEWGTLVEEAVAAPVHAQAARASSEPLLAADVEVGEWQSQPTGVSELDRVLGGGLMPGSATLLGGEPGIGKSTLLLQLAAGCCARGASVLYVSGEESSAQVRLRADRLGILPDRLWLVNELELVNVLAHVESLSPDVVLVDSIQTIQDSQHGSPAGSLVQVRECAAQLVQVAKSRRMAVWLAGHVTKDGSLAGPRMLEHLVDTVLSFEGDRHGTLRLLRASKHRFGSTEQVGVFEMSGTGLVPVLDPSSSFLADRREDVPGSVVAAAVEGRRPLLVEVQALVGAPQAGSPRRAAQGLDSGRLVTVLAVLERRLGLRVASADVHALVVGGVRVNEPALDAALALALVSSASGTALPSDLVAFGEVGLGGELRQVQQPARRLEEAARLGFRRALVPRSVDDGPEGLQMLRAGTIGEAVALAGLPLP